MVAITSAKTQKTPKEINMPELTFENLELAASYLTEHPEALLSAWGTPFQREGGLLFTCLCPAADLSPNGVGGPNCLQVGCITQVKGCLVNRNPARGYVAIFPESVSQQDQDKFYADLRDDERIPPYEFNLRVDQIPAFLEWQKRYRTLIGEGPTQ
jgi:hypothetical protein